MRLERKYTEERKVINGKNDLLTWCLEHGEFGQTLINEWDNQRNGDMRLYKPGSGRVVHWKCSVCGENYEKSIRTRVSGNMHEPCGRKRGRENLILYHKRKVKFEESLAGRRSDLLKEWDYAANDKLNMEPETTPVTSGKRVNWICGKCGYHYSRVIRQRTQFECGCPKCRKANRNKKAASH